MPKLSHLDARGRVRMVDVGAKRVTRREATAEGRVDLGPEAFAALREGRLVKGDASAVVRLAGIQAAKRTAEWIPLCHTLPLEVVEVELALEPRTHSARVTARVRTRGRTGVEMEALVAVTAACLALYDMAKAVERGMTIRDVRLLEKRGGRSGLWRRSASARGKHRSGAE